MTSSDMPDTTGATATTDTPTLRLESARKAYGGVVAVDDVSFTVPRNTVVGLLGPNGAGKTTLVDLITGVQRADRGDMWLDGRPLRGSVTTRSRSGLARTFQHPQLIQELNALDNIMIGSHARRLHSLGGVIGRLLAETFGASSTDRERRRCMEALADYDLPDLTTPASDLSLGEQRLVEVARALVAQPSLLLLDEPFAGSDPHSRDAIVRMIREAVARGRSVVLVDHNVDIVTEVADRIVLMSNGAKVFDGPAPEALASQAMRDVYFGAAIEDDRNDAIGEATDA